MVKGLDKFREHFAGFEDRYVLIGGSASDLAMRELGVDFRLTKDLDIVLCLEALDREFAEKFWEFIRIGGYEIREKSSGKPCFYRFSKPEDAAFPFMLELFSRIPDIIDLEDGATLTPLPLDWEVSSLSAILLNESSYRFILRHRKTIDGVVVAGAEALIPLKAFAFQDLKRRKEAGESGLSKHIKKHRNDIFRLFTILNPNIAVSLNSEMAEELKESFVVLRTEEIDLEGLGLKGETVESILGQLEQMYGLNL
jgi:hypothetical protein